MEWERADLLVTAILVLPLLYLSLAAWSFHRRAIKKLALAPNLIARVTTGRRVAALLLLTLGWIFAVVAVAGPMGRSELSSGGEESHQEVTWLEGDEAGEEVTVRQRVHEVIFLLDASASMGVNDTRVGLTRLEYAKEIIDETIGRLAGDSVALYAFTSEVTQLVPSTVDYLFLRLLLRRVGINEGDVAGTDFAEALDGVARRHFDPRVEKQRSLVILTDGGDTKLEAAQGEEREQQLRALLGRVPKSEKIQTYCVGLGSHGGELIPGVTFGGAPVRSTLDEPFLARVAQEGNGHYYFADDYSALSLADRLVREFEQKGDEEELVAVEVSGSLQANGSPQGPHHWTFKRYFQIPLLLAILALSCEIILMQRVRRDYA